MRPGWYWIFFGPCRGGLEQVREAGGGEAGDNGHLPHSRQPAAAALALEGAIGWQRVPSMAPLRCPLDPIRGNDFPVPRPGGRRGRGRDAGCRLAAPGHAPARRHCRQPGLLPASSALSG
jgi:hypothetical protein